MRGIYQNRAESLASESQVRLRRSGIEALALVRTGIFCPTGTPLVGEEKPEKDFGPCWVLVRLRLRGVGGPTPILLL